MKTRVQKWGRSLAVRIPKSLGVEARLAKDTLVELSLIEGRLVIRPLGAESLTLDELVQGVMDHNIHGEWNTGPAVGREIW